MAELKKNYINHKGLIFKHGMTPNICDALIEQYGKNEKLYIISDGKKIFGWCVKVQGEILPLEKKGTRFVLSLYEEALKSGEITLEDGVIKQ